MLIRDGSKAIAPGYVTNRDDKSTFPVHVLYSLTYRGKENLTTVKECQLSSTEVCKNINKIMKQIRMKCHL